MIKVLYWLKASSKTTTGEKISHLNKGTFVDLDDYIVTKIAPKIT